MIKSGERIVKWDDKGIIFFIRSLRQFSAAQSLTALMNSLCHSGYNVHLVTQSEPSGDDYAADDRVKRYALDVLETRGHTTEEAFFKIIGEIPVQTVVFIGEVYPNTVKLFQTVQRLGRSAVLHLDRSPLYYVSSGSEGLSAACLYMVRNADAVFTASETDLKLIENMGAKRCSVQPFYFPYDESEVSPASFKGGRIVYYTTYAGRNVRCALSAFARLHEKNPEARMTVVCLNLKKSPTLESLIDDIQNSTLKDCVSIEPQVLKPLRFLRDADVSLTYAHPVYMPETVMESITAGIPAVILRDGEFSEDSFPSMNVSACDEKAIEEKMAEYIIPKNSEEYCKKAREVLTVQYRDKLLAQFLDELSVIESVRNDRLQKALERLNELSYAIKSSDNCAETVRTMLCGEVNAGEAFGALMNCHKSFAQITEIFKKCDLVAQNDLIRMNVKSAVFSKFDAHLGKPEACCGKVLAADVVARLAVSGAEISEIPSLIKNIHIDTEQIADILLNCLYVETGLRDIRIPCAASADSLCKEPVIDSAVSAFMSYNLENNGYFQNKGYSLMALTIRFLNWLTKPMHHNIFGKCFIGMLNCWIRLKKSVNLKGRKRLMKRKVEQVEPEDVRKIQLMVLKIMLEFERICKKHNLRYYLAGGTILGGIRHKGFIPWDDDMDITMPRPDYEKFLKIAKKELSDEFIMDKDCVPFCHNRIEYKDSHFDTMWRNGGIFLDILALDGSPDDEAMRLKHEKKTKFWRFWMLEKARPLPALSSNRSVQMIFLKRLVARMMPRWFLKWRWHSWAARFSCDDTSSWVCLPASIYTYEQERFPKEYWGEPVMMEFEGHMMPTMQHWEDYLICHFGDYMKMPPLTTRKSHHFIYRYDLGKYKNIPTEELEKELVGPLKRGE